MPMCAASAGVWASAQSMTAEASATSFGPPTSISPPDWRKPRELYVTTTYPVSASFWAWARYSICGTDQLVGRTTRGYVRLVSAGATTLPLRTVPPSPGMSAKRTVGAAAAAAGAATAPAAAGPVSRSAAARTASVGEERGARMGHLSGRVSDAVRTAK
ncbi:hypothetical protein GA0115246_104367 [Streptomyces sp. SolWspMP-sol7th]|nr:hypothetical protein GA0115246_104367 [Streptomyces sp. SolWspMP-sol7th]